MISEIRIEPDHERHANYTKAIESSANFDASRDPQLVVNPPSISGISRVNVTGHHRFHILPSHQDSSLDYHDGADMNLADGSGTNYGDSHWNQTWPITVDPNYDPRNDFEKSLQAAVDAAVLELTSGSESGSGCSCSASGSTGTGTSEFVAEGEDPLPCKTVGRWKWNWHHLLPKEVFDSATLEALGLKGVNIDAAQYGWMMHAFDHMGIHPEWNTDWKEWVAKKIEVGEKVTVEQLEQAIKDMKSKYSLEVKGVQASHSYWLRQLAYQQASRLINWDGAPDAVRAASQRFKALYQAEKEALQQIAKNSPKTPKLRGPGGVKLGGIGGFFWGITAGWALGAEDPVMDAIDGATWATRFGAMDEPWMFRDDALLKWDAYQAELDAQWESCQAP